jgi:hypothetical protein
MPRSSSPRFTQASGNLSGAGKWWNVDVFCGESMKQIKRHSSIDCLPSRRYLFLSCLHLKVLADFEPIGEEQGNYEIRGYQSLTNSELSHDKDSSNLHHLCYSTIPTLENHLSGKEAKVRQESTLRGSDVKWFSLDSLESDQWHPHAEFDEGRVIILA